MIRMSHSAAIGLSLLLAATLAPAASTAAQDDAPASPTFEWTEIEGIRDWPQMLTSTPDGADLLTTAQYGPTGQIEKQAAWRSTDSRTWESVDLPGRDLVQAMAGGPVGVVAVGSDNSLSFSPDGLAWEGVKLPKKDRGVRHAVVATPTGFVVVGALSNARKTKRGYSYTYTPAAWTSTDGKAWTLTELSEKPNIARAVAVAPDGTVLAVGTGIDTGPRAWRLEADGSWLEVAAPPDDASYIGNAGGRFVISDSMIQLDETWQTTTDGSAWVAGPPREPAIGRPIAAAGGALFAGTAEDQPGLVLRWSPDWETWSESVVQDFGAVQWVWAAGTLANGDLLLATSEPPAEGETEGAIHVWAGTPAASP